MSAQTADQNSNLRRIILVLLALGVVAMISLIAGAVVVWGLCLAAVFFALYCVIACVQLPPALVPPKETSGPKHEAYLQALRARLANNPRTRELPLSTSADIETAVAH